MPPFTSVAANRPRRSAFNLSHERKLTCDMGFLIPVMCEQLVPGDSFQLGVEIVTRMMPMVTPVLHEINVFIHDFFIPNRLMWPGDGVTTGWEPFISGGAAGNDAQAVPRWNPGAHGVGSLWDYFGFPIAAIGTGALPVDFPRIAYNMVYNAYYRDEQQVALVALTNETLLKRAWEKDYFTSALPWQQRGTAPALPVSGSAVWDPATVVAGAVTGTAPKFVTVGADAHAYEGVAQEKTNMLAFMNSNNVSLTTFNVSDLRLAFQIQRWQERNARSGVRYTEFLLAHYGVSPRDERLQRPEYIGGAKFGVMVSEVLQTSRSDAGQPPQGTMAGHGLVAGRDYCGQYHAQEFGVLLRILSIMPRCAYDSQGVERQWLPETRYEYYTPELAHLSEQPVTRAEIFADATEADNRTVFGYQGRWDELRFRASKVCGLFRGDAAGTLNAWHLARYFTAFPSLNQTFVEPDTTALKRIFAVTSQPGFIVNVANMVKAVRPLPESSEPGLIDHT